MTKAHFHVTIPNKDCFQPYKTAREATKDKHFKNKEARIIICRLNYNECKGMFKNE